MNDFIDVKVEFPIEIKNYCLLHGFDESYYVSVLINIILQDYSLIELHRKYSILYTLIKESDK